MCGYFCIGFIYFVIAGKKLNESNSIEAIDKAILSEQTNHAVKKLSKYASVLIILINL